MPELAKAVANAQRLERDFHEASASRLAAESALESAVADDRARLAEARLKGRKKPPQAKAVGDAKVALEEAERQQNAVDDARKRGADIVVETLEHHRAEYVPGVWASLQEPRECEVFSFQK